MPLFKSVAKFCEPAFPSLMAAVPKPGGMFLPGFHSCGILIPVTFAWHGSSERSESPEGTENCRTFARLPDHPSPHSRTNRASKQSGDKKVLLKLQGGSLRSPPPPEGVPVWTYMNCKSQWLGHASEKVLYVVKVAAGILITLIRKYGPGESRPLNPQKICFLG